MSQSAKRRALDVDLGKQNMQAYLEGLPPVVRPVVAVWLKAWDWIYYCVALATYSGMIYSTVMAFYFSVVEPNFLRMLLSSGCVLLLIYVNKVNPK